MYGSPILLILAVATAWPAYSQQFKNPDNLGPDMPTPQVIVDRMLELAHVRAGEMVYDLGCGDGRIVITAAERFNAHAVGIELSRDIFDRTYAHVRTLGLQDRVMIVHGNALHYDLSPADVVTLYLLTSSNERLRPALERYLKPTARVVSHDFEIRGWNTTKMVMVPVDGRQHKIYLYEMASRKP